MSRVGFPISFSLHNKMRETQQVILYDPGVMFEDILPHHPKLAIKPDVVKYPHCLKKIQSC